MTGIRLFRSMCLARWYQRTVLTIVALSTFLVLTLYILLPRKQVVTPVERKSKSWIKVHGSTYIYSAFWDDRDTPHVKIISVGPYEEWLAGLKCHFKTKKNVSTVDTIFQIMDFENNGMDHTPLFFLCYPSGWTKPTYVALASPSGKLSAWLPVQTMSPERNVDDKMALCVRPLFSFSPEDNVRLVEFIAYYQLLGVGHFVFYDYQLDPFTRQTLQQLHFHGVSLQLLPWDIPLSVEQSWQNGQVASITDCVYRLASGYEFVLVVDLDEFIVPAHNVTLQSLLRPLTDVATHRSASYIFRQAFFCADYTDDTNGANAPLHLVTQTKAIRKVDISPWKSRAKSIVRPMAVILPGIHKILLSYGDWQPIAFVDARDAYIHHYRSGFCSWWESSSSETVKDDTAFRYRDDLLRSPPIRMYLKLYGSL